MKKISSKSELAVVLSKLKCFEKPKVRTEQYMTEPEIAAELLWHMSMRGELVDKTIADLGSGTGILGLGALLLGAEKVFLVENDKDAMEISKQNYNGLKEQGFKLGKAVFVLKDIKDFNEKVDVVVENPPFGTKQKHADKVFLEKATSIADTVWSFHKTSTERFVIAFAEDNKFKAAEKIKFRFPIHAAHDFHTRKIHRVEITLYRFEKQK